MYVHMHFWRCLMDRVGECPLFDSPSVWDWLRKPDFTKGLVNYGRHGKSRLNLDCISVNAVNTAGQPHLNLKLL